MTDAVNFSDPARFVELFVVGKQVMADKVALKDLYNVFGVRIEFYSGPRTEP